MDSSPDMPESPAFALWLNSTTGSVYGAILGLAYVGREMCGGPDMESRGSEATTTSGRWTKKCPQNGGTDLFRHVKNSFIEIAWKVDLSLFRALETILLLFYILPVGR